MKTLKYTEIMPRVAIEKTKLIEKTDLVDLVGRNLEAIRCFLLETSYREEIIRIPKERANSISMEEALLENYAKTFNNLIKSSTGDVKKVILALARKIEVGNVKTLLRATKNKTNAAEALKHIIPFGKLSKESYREILLSSPTIEEVIESLSKTEFGPILLKARTTGTFSDDLLTLEIALDKDAYKQIFDSIEKLKGLDKRIAKNVLGIEVDAKNAKIILRCKAIRMSHDLIKTYLIPSLLFDEETLEKAIESPDVKSLAKIFLDTAEKTKNVFYKSVFNQILKQCNLSLSQLEVILERATLEVSLKVLKKYLKYYNIGFVLASINLKWFEIRNLRSLIVGAERKIPPAQIRRFLIL